MSLGSAILLATLTFVAGVVYGYGLGHYHATMEWLQRTRDDHH